MLRAIATACGQTTPPAGAADRSSDPGGAKEISGHGARAFVKNSQKAYSIEYQTEGIAHWQSPAKPVFVRGLGFFRDDYVKTCNHHISKRAPNRISPVQAFKDWYVKSLRYSRSGFITNQDLIANDPNHFKTRPSPQLHKNVMRRPFISIEMG